MSNESLEQAKLWVSIGVPIATVLLGGLILHRIGKRFETKQWISQKLIEQRQSIYGNVAKPLNQLYCFFMRYGDWKSLSPAQILVFKRQIASELHPFFPLFTQTMHDAFCAFEETLFETFNGPGQDARLRLDPKKYESVEGWTPEWRRHFSTSSRTTRERVFTAYENLVHAFAQDANIDTTQGAAWKPRFRKLRPPKNQSDPTVAPAATPAGAIPGAVAPDGSSPAAIAPAGSSPGAIAPAGSSPALLASAAASSPAPAASCAPAPAATSPATAGVASAPPTSAPLVQVGDVDWGLRVRELIAVAPLGVAREYVEANAAAVQSAVIGRGPDTTVVDPEAGVCAVVNISSVHVPAFVRRSLSLDPKPYKNGYDLGKFVVGTPAPPRARKTRELVDAALPLLGRSARDHYYCAVELNGSGVRFYGDVSLVLKPSEVHPGTVVLDRNSFDLMRKPLLDRIDSARPNQELERQRVAAQLAGLWGTDLPAMATTKILGASPQQPRRLTTAQISDALLEDEDYLEVLRFGSFGVAHLREARLSASDVAVDARIGDRARIGPAPDFAALLWRHRRRRAERSLRSAGVLVTVATTSGRSRV
jgi:hypothetical protein